VKYDNLFYDDSTVFNMSFEEDVNSGIYMNTQRSTGKHQISFGDGSGFYSSDSRRTYTSNNIIDNSIWHHKAITVTSQSNMKIYVDCIELGGDYSGIGGNLQYSSFAGVIGRPDRSLTAPADYFKGAFDDFQFWNRALSVNEIITLCAKLNISDEIVNVNDIKIYPNPSADLLKIKSNNKQLRSIDVYDNSGRLILSTKYLEELDLSGFTKGSYLVKFNVNTSFVTRRIVLE
jgi:hypothetical protein